MTKAILTLALLSIFSSLVCSATSSSHDPWRFRPGLRNSPGKQRLNEAQLRLLAESLRQKTGWRELQFDDAGFLVLGDRTRLAGGSATARELLAATVDGAKAFELEAHNHAAALAFACITVGTVHYRHQTNTRLEVQQLQLDFADFVELRGDHEVRAAFDVGFAVLHELSHGVLGLHDVGGASTELGACDAVINQMRRELALPERQGYNPRVQGEAFGAGRTLMAQLIFTRTDSDQTRRFYLRWEEKRVARQTHPARR